MNTYKVKYRVTEIVYQEFYVTAPNAEEAREAFECGSGTLEHEEVLEQTDSEFLGTEQIS